MAEGESSPTGGLGDLFSRLQQARADLKAQEEAIEGATVEGHAAGGAVVIRLTGSLEAESVHIDPSIIDASDPALVEDAVLAALHDALDKIVDSGLPCKGGQVRALAVKPTLEAWPAPVDLGGILAGVDLEELMGNLGRGMDLLALSGLGEFGEDDEHADVEVDDEPQA